MERLTEKHYLGTDHYMKCSGNCNVDMDCIDCPSFDRLVERLAAYEDTGLEPEEVSDAVVGSKLLAKSQLVSAFGVAAERLRELAEADRAGRLVVLPCKAGDVLYRASPSGVVVHRVVHGRWKYYHKQNKAVCTRCSFERDLDENFGAAISCPNCGAKME